MIEFDYEARQQEAQAAVAMIGFALDYCMVVLALFVAVAYVYWT